MTEVKICGLQRLDDALVAAESGATMLGFVFAPSRRRVNQELARDIITQVRERADARTVGIFVNATPAEMDETARFCGLDYVQLSGDEDDSTVRALKTPAIKVLHVAPGTDGQDLRRRADASRAELLLLDTARAGAYGGTGTTFDWSVIPELEKPLLLAGGLRPDNVRDAVRTVRPWGVDVSSGVETDGRKDVDKIRAFIRAAKEEQAL